MGLDICFDIFGGVLETVAYIFGHLFFPSNAAILPLISPATFPSANAYSSLGFFAARPAPVLNDYLLVAFSPTLGESGLPPPLGRSQPYRPLSCKWRGAER